MENIRLIFLSQIKSKIEILTTPFHKKGMEVNTLDMISIDIRRNPVSDILNTYKLNIDKF